MARSLRVAIEGCCHGELDSIYDAVEYVQSVDGQAIDLLICCGDFQAVRNEQDLECLSCPLKYRAMQTFYKYYSGERVAPVLTIFVGGNHEASNHLQELPYGGWVAPNIFFLGYAGVINVGGLRVAGLSGIFKGGDHQRGRWERPPYDRDAMRSVYHVRQFDEQRLAMLTGPIDVFISHDWPTGIALHGDTKALLRRKSFFAGEVADGSLGSPVNERLLKHLRPRLWFAAHLHVKFAAVVRHDEEKPVAAAPQGAPSDPVTNDPNEIDLDDDGSGGVGEAAGDPNEIDLDGGGEVAEEQEAVTAEPAAAPVNAETRFLALDKCVPRHEFLQVMTVPIRDEALPAGAEAGAGAAGAGPGVRVCWDPEWLAIIRRTHALCPRHRTAPRPHLPPAATRPISATERQEAVDRVAAAVAAARATDEKIDPSSEIDPSFRLEVLPGLFRRSVRAFDPPEGFDPTSHSGCGRSGGRGGGRGGRGGRVDSRNTGWGYPGPRQQQPQQVGNWGTDWLYSALGLEHLGDTVPCGTEPPKLPATTPADAGSRSGRGGRFDTRRALEDPWDARHRSSMGDGTRAALSGLEIPARGGGRGGRDRGGRGRGGGRFGGRGGGRGRGGGGGQKRPRDFGRGPAPMWRGGGWAPPPPQPWMGGPPRGMPPVAWQGPPPPAARAALPPVPVDAGLSPAELAARIRSEAAAVGVYRNMSSKPAPGLPPPATRPKIDPNEIDLDDV